MECSRQVLQELHTFLNNDEALNKRFELSRNVPLIKMVRANELGALGEQIDVS